MGTQPKTLLNIHINKVTATSLQYHSIKYALSIHPVLLYTDLCSSQSNSTCPNSQGCSVARQGLPEFKSKLQLPFHSQIAKSSGCLVDNPGGKTKNKSICIGGGFARSQGEWKSAIKTCSGEWFSHPLPTPTGGKCPNLWHILLDLPEFPARLFLT